MGSVWKAEDPLRGGFVALKILAEELRSKLSARRRFLSTANIVRALDHPCIAAIYDVGEQGDLVYAAIEFIDGETLSARVARSPISESDVIRIVSNVASALAYAHGAGVVHRDVTSNNVMLDRAGHVYLMDFGLALAVGVSRFTSTGAIAGTMPYLSPEATLHEDADPRTDIYGLGVILYETLAGVLPFRADNAQALMYSIVHTEPESLRRHRPDVSEGLEALVMKMLAKSRVERPQSAEELMQALAGLESPGEGAGTSATRPLVQRAALPEHLHIALLPAEAIGPEDANDPVAVTLAKGLEEALVAALGGRREVHLVPPAMIPRDGMSDLASLARRIGANLLLRPRVRRSQERVRLTFSLIDPHRGVQLAAGGQDGAVTELFDLEDRLVAVVLRALDLGSAPGAVAGRSTDPAAEERLRLAQAYLEQPDNEAYVDAAIAILEQLARSPAAPARVHASLGRAFLSRYRLTRGRTWEYRAVQACECASALDPELPEVQLTLGELLALAGKNEDAAHRFERVLAHEPGWPEALAGLVRAREALGDHAGAERACHDAIVARPDAWGGHYELGALMFRGGEYERALEAWRRVVELSPDNARGHSVLGAALFYLGRSAEAIESYQRSIAIRPTPEACTSLGTVLFYEDRIEEAVAAFEKAASLRPADPLGWGNLGSACRRLPSASGRTREALETAILLMEGQLKSNPSNAQGWALLGGWLAYLGRKESARAAVERALAQEGKDARVLQRAGGVLYLLGDRSRALECLAAAVRSGYSLRLMSREYDLVELLDDPKAKNALEMALAQRGSNRSLPRTNEPPEEEVLR